MNLVHYASTRLTRLYSTHGQEDPMTYTKPCGLWVSVEGNDDGWREWCATENFREESLLTATPIKLVERDQTLVLSGSLDLLRFTREYGVDTPYGDKAIDWREVAKSYKGIIIAPYCWEQRLSLRWYYPWDCASGCFWDTSAIVIGQEEAENKRNIV